MTVSVLFARSDSFYKTINDCDVWDKGRDATKFTGASPVVAHPPCRAWGQLRKLANPLAGEKELALFAVDTVRKNGGVLEHPKKSTLWPAAGLPSPGERDKFGGWTLPVFQSWWGHKAEKATLLYIVGCEPSNIPDLPLLLGEAAFICGSPGRRGDGTRLHKGDLGWRPEITKAEREHTPPALAMWLVELAARCATGGNDIYQ